jgi:hypothetical protein
MSFIKLKLIVIEWSTSQLDFIKLFLWHPTYAESFFYGLTTQYYSTSVETVPDALIFDNLKDLKYQVLVST